MVNPPAAPAEPAIRPTPSWSVAASEALIRAWNAGEAPDALAHRLGISTGAIYARVRTLRRQGVALQARRRPTASAAQAAGRPNGRARRKCLTCGKKFRSTHIGNRICEPCVLLSGLF